MEPILLLDWYYPVPGKPSTTIGLIYESPRPRGPWTLIDTRTYSPEAWYTPSIYQPSAVAATANGKPMRMIESGNYQSSFYSLFATDLILRTR